MNKSIENKQILKNLSLSLFTQVISLAVSFVLSFIVPKFIDEYQYAYWHIYLLYAGYVGVLHFGLLDGIMLRYSQYDYEELDKSRMCTQFLVLLIISSVAFIMVFIYGFLNGGLTKIIAILIAFKILTKNILTYNSFLFQITNRIRHYAFLWITHRLVYGIIITLLIVFNCHYFVWLCVADLVADCVGILVSLTSNRSLHFGNLLTIQEALNETWLNISSGIVLMLSTWSSMLIVGGAKMIIEWKWGALVFGKTSFAFSVTNLVLTFVAAISVVLFPSLKRMRRENLPFFYKKLRDMMMPFLFWSLLLYYPECWILKLWLPKYSNSLLYLGLLSPMIVYASVISLLTNNYLKAYRQERTLFLINLISVFLAVCLYGITVYWLNNFTFLLLAVVLVVILRSVVTELCVMKLIQQDFRKNFIIEFIMTCAFLVSAQFVNRNIGLILYLMFLLCYSYFNLPNIKKRVCTLFNLKK